MNCEKNIARLLKMAGKKIRKMNIPPKQKMEYTCCVSCNKYTGNSDMS